MKFFTRILLPITLFLGIGVAAILWLPYMSNGNTLLYYILVVDVLSFLYYFSFKIKKNKKSHIYYLYLNSLVVLFALFTVLMTLLVAFELLPIKIFTIIYFSVVGLNVLLILGLNLMSGGLNEHIKNHKRGEHGLAKMIQLCEEILHILRQKGKDTEEAVTEIEKVKETLKYSDPVSHRSVYSIENKIIHELKEALGSSKHRLIGKVGKVLKDVDEVLFLIKKRNQTLKENK